MDMPQDDDAFPALATTVADLTRALLSAGAVSDYDPSAKGVIVIGPDAPLRREAAAVMVWPSSPPALVTTTGLVTMGDPEMMNLGDVVGMEIAWLKRTRECLRYMREENPPPPLTIKIDEISAPTWLVYCQWHLTTFGCLPEV